MLSAAFLICTAIIASINCQTMPTMVTRAQWNARAPTSISYMTLPVKYVFIHHGAGPSTACTTQSACSSTWKSYQNYHMDTNGWADIGYSFGVGEDGRIYEGRGWDRVGAHTSGYNSNGIGICFIGDFMNRAPTASAQKAVQDLIAYGVSKKYISSTYTLGGHRNAGSTTCPGDTLYNIIKTWPRFGW